MNRAEVFGAHPVVRRLVELARQLNEERRRHHERTDQGSPSLPVGLPTWISKELDDAERNRQRADGTEAPNPAHP